MINHKKGQFYILTAIIFISMMFMLTRANMTSISLSKDKDADIKELYDKEVGNIINNAIYEGNNITLEIDDFSDKFINHYADNNKDIQIIYLYKDQSQLLVSNNFEVSIKVMPENIDVDSEEKKAITLTSNTTSIIIEGKEYSYLWGYNPRQFESIILEKELI